MIDTNPYTGIDGISRYCMGLKRVSWLL